MLEDLRPGDRPFLGDVPHDKDGDAHPLRRAHQAGGAFAHLPHAAGGGGKPFQIDRLNGIDDEKFHAVQFFQNIFQAVFVDDEQGIRFHAEAVAAHLYLRAALLRRNVKNLMFLRKMPRDLGEQRGFPDAGIPADQYHGGGHDAAPQNPVEFGVARRDTPALFLRDLAEPHRPLTGRSGLFRALLGRGEFLCIGVPAAAVRALSDPLGARRAALRTYVGRYGFRHTVPLIFCKFPASCPLFQRNPRWTSSSAAWRSGSRSHPAARREGGGF